MFWQWQSLGNVSHLPFPAVPADLIAVNYAARAAGITRHMRVAQAMKHCPELRLVHVQTIGCVQQPGAAAGTADAGGTSAAAAGAAAAAAAVKIDAAACSPAKSTAGAAAAAAAGIGSDTVDGAAAAAAAGDVEGSAQDRGSSKACLQRYRRVRGELSMG
jgi:nucleotidyltransferase/DNA polymerase involved in DNA repair